MNTAMSCYAMQPPACQPSAGMSAQPSMQPASLGQPTAMTPQQGSLLGNPAANTGMNPLLSSPVANPATSTGNLLSSLIQPMLSLMTTMMTLMLQLVTSLLQEGNSNSEAGETSDTATAGATANRGASTSEGTTPPAVSSPAAPAANPAAPGTGNATTLAPQSGAGTGRPQVIIEGDSLSTVAGGSYAQRLEEAISGQADVQQLAHGGDQLRGGRGIVNQDIPDADPSRSDNVAVLWAGTNDLFGDASGQEVYDNLAKKAQAFKDKGWRVVVLTSVQFGGSRDSAAQDEQRRNFNNLIRTQGGPWDALTDVASLPEFSDQDNGVTENRDIYAGDGIHLTGEGYRHIFEAVMNTLRPILG